jgi:hypothetical protein
MTAITDLFSDTTVTPRQTRNSLEDVSERCRQLLQTLNTTLRARK